MALESSVGWPRYDADEVDAVREVLQSGRANYWTGVHGKKFESEFASWCEVKFAVALMNGTVALELALQALGIGLGDEVVVPPRSFIASVSAVLKVGAKPIFADVDINSGNITADKISKVLTPKTRAVICVHLAGWPCDMDPIIALSRRHDFSVVEDCAQAHGAVYKGRKVGSIGDVGAWSFCQDKIISTGGEGGMITTNDETISRKIWSLKDHGKDFDIATQQSDSIGFRWTHSDFGTNARMTEIQAVIGRLQLAKIDRWWRQRASNASNLRSALKPFAGLNGVIRLPRFVCSDDCICQCLADSDEGCQTQVCRHAFYRFYAYIRPDNMKKGWSRDRIFDELHRRGVPCFSGTCPEIYLEEAFAATDYRPEKRLKNARILGETSLAFLVHPTLTQDELDVLKAGIEEVFGAACKI